MAFSDIPVFLNSFNEDIESLERRYNTDPNNGILISYIGMNARVKRIITNDLDIALKELELAKARYSEKFKMKDIEFHIQQACENLAFIKHMLKDIIEMYESQAEYSKISEKWKDVFMSVDKRMKIINSRLDLIGKILNGEY